MSAADKSKAKTASKSFEQEWKGASKQSTTTAVKSSSEEVENRPPCGWGGGACYGGF